MKLVERVIGIAPRELALLRGVNQMGAASIDELAIRLNRAGEDIMPEIRNLLARRLLQARSVVIGREEIPIYLADRDIRHLL